MSKVNWKNELILPPVKTYRQGEQLNEDVIFNWLIITGLIRPSGREPDKKRDRLNKYFGKGNWKQGWKLENRILDRPVALALYEEAYYEYFCEFPSIVNWLCKTASDVYDNDVSNVKSGFDYSIQENSAAHLQDISVRRVIARLGRKLDGDHLVEIHDEGTEGFHINPGQVPFHKPDEIMSYPVRDWWEPLSIEAFWQHNKVILVDQQNIKLEFIKESEFESYYSLSEDWIIKIKKTDKRNLLALPGDSLKRILD